MTLTLVAAVAQNNVIGKDGHLPWNLPEDLKRFKQLTSGHNVLMGRKTFESIVRRLGKPLPNRTNIVITRQSDYQVPDGVEVYHSIVEAIQAHQNQDIFCIGGGQIYQATLDQADVLDITHVAHEVDDGDTFFPKIDQAKWKKTWEEQHDGYTFTRYKRK